MKIVASVTFVHAFLVLATLYFQPSAPKIVPRQTIRVKTVITQADPEVTIISESEVDKVIANQITLPLVQPTPPLVPTPPTPPTPQAEPTPPAAPTRKADPPARGGPPLPNNVAPPRTSAHPQQVAAAKKNPVKPTAKPANGPPKPKQDQLISMVQKSLNSLNSNSAGKVASGKTTRPKTLGPLASEALSFEAKYEQELVSYLEALFSFPEKGEVKVKLTLKREGNVQHVEILKASSAKNREYVLASLASCSFPAFGTHFQGEAAHSFTLNLTSE